MINNSSPLILCLETATEICSVCVSSGNQVLAICASESQNHATDLHPFIQKVLSEAEINIKQLQAVAVSRGPGSYTGLRIGWASAKGLCYALNVPLISIDTMQALAAGLKQVEPEASYYMPMLDARRMEVYTALYLHNLEIAQNVQSVIFDTRAPFVYPEGLIYGGNGAEKAIPFMPASAIYVSDLKASAAFMAPLAHLQYINRQFENLAYSEPFYLKDARITVKNENTTS